MDFGKSLFKVRFFFSVSKARIIGDKDVLVQTGSDINLTCRAEQVIKDEQVMILDLCTLNRLKMYFST